MNSCNSIVSRFAHSIWWYASDPPPTSLRSAYSRPDFALWRGGAEHDAGPDSFPFTDQHCGKPPHCIRGPGYGERVVWRLETPAVRPLFFPHPPHLFFPPPPPPPPHLPP